MIIDEENNSVFFIEKLNNLKKELDNDTLDLQRIRKDIKQLNDYKETQNYDYLNDLLDPIKRKGVKIPSSKPIPSCSFQMHNYLTFRIVAATGDNVFLMNPFFLANTNCLNKRYTASDGVVFTVVRNVGDYFYCFDQALDGTKSSSSWGFPAAFSQVIPDVYEQYRLVSSCLTLRYVGPLEEAQGVFGGGIVFDKSRKLGMRLKRQDNSEIATGNSDFDKYANFELIRDSPYFKEFNCLEGIKMLYFPLDNSFNEFKKVYDGNKLKIVRGNNQRPYDVIIDDCYFNTGFFWACFLQGCTLSNPIHYYRIDFYSNYECLPRAELLNYIPISINVNYAPKELLKNVLEEIQDKAIQKINNY